MAKKKNEDKIAEKFLSVAQVAEMLAMSEAAIYGGLCETHELKRIRLRSKGKGRATIRFYLSDVTDWMNKRIRSAQPDIPRQKRGQARDRVIDMARFKQTRKW